jgi:D-inositol-3-phosphate glycosyltransferase
VKFIPPTTRPQLVKWFQAATVCVVPSYSESFGLVAIEAQACGTPVIAARVGGLPTAVTDGVGGVLVDGHNAYVWSQEITKVIKNPELLNKLSYGAVAHASHFGWDDTTEKLGAVYEEAVISARVRAGA